MTRHKIVISVGDLKQTCSACPSQWEGTDAKGNSIYIRYRSGRLQVQQSGILLEQGTTLFYQKVGDDYDGCIDLDQVIELTSGAIVWTR